MYGNREAAREANKELTERAGTAKGGNGAADADPLGAAIAGMKDNAAAPAEVHPLAVPAAPPAAAQPAAGGDGYIYYLQAGAFRDIADAESAKAKLALLGFEASISDRTSDSGVLHRVRMGPYNQVEAMNKARAKLQDSGVDVAIVRNQK
jgi:cell division protein FtsN